MSKGDNRMELLLTDTPEKQTTTILRTLLKTLPKLIYTKISSVVAILWLLHKPYKTEFPIYTYIQLTI